MAKRKHVYESTFEDIANLFSEAANSGKFVFDKVPYSDFIAFLKEFVPNFVLEIGVRDQHVIDELNRIADLARSKC